MHLRRRWSRHKMQECRGPGSQAKDAAKVAQFVARRRTGAIVRMSPTEVDDLDGGGRRREPDDVAGLEVVVDEAEPVKVLGGLHDRTPGQGPAISKVGEERLT